MTDPYFQQNAIAPQYAKKDPFNPSQFLEPAKTQPTLASITPITTTAPRVATSTGGVFNVASPNIQIPNINGADPATVAAQRLNPSNAMNTTQNPSVQPNAFVPSTIDNQLAPQQIANQLNQGGYTYNNQTGLYTNDKTGETVDVTGARVDTTKYGVKTLNSNQGASAMGQASVDTAQAEEKARQDEVNAQIKRTQDAMEANLRADYATKQQALAQSQGQESATQSALEFKLGRKDTIFGQQEMSQLESQHSLAMNDLKNQLNDSITKMKSAVQNDDWDAYTKSRDQYNKIQDQQLKLTQENRLSQTSQLETILKNQAISKGIAETASTVAPYLSDLLKNQDPNAAAQTIQDYASKSGMSVPTLYSAITNYENDRMDKQMTEAQKNYNAYAEQEFASGGQPMSFYNYSNQYKDQNFQLQLDRLNIAQQNANTAADKAQLQGQINELKIQNQTAVSTGQIINKATGRPVTVSDTAATEIAGFQNFLGTYIPTVSDLLKRVETGAISGGLQKKAETAPIAQYMISKDREAFNSEVAAMNNAYIYLKSGKQINESEMERLAQSLPDVSLTVQQNKIRINQFQQIMKKEMDARLGLRGWSIYEGPTTSYLTGGDDFSGTTWE